MFRTSGRDARDIASRVRHNGRCESRARDESEVSGPAQGSTSDPAGVDPQCRVTRATVMFADIVGFTQLAEKIGPEAAYFAVTGALKILDGVARRHGGSVDKYLGDCV